MGKFKEINTLVREIDWLDELNQSNIQDFKSQLDSLINNLNINNPADEETFEKLHNIKILLNNIINDTQQELTEAKEVFDLENFLEKLKEYAESEEPITSDQLRYILDFPNEDIPKEYLISGALSVIARFWVSIKEIKWWKIKFRQPKETHWLKTASRRQVLWYENVFNNYIEIWKFSFTDFNKALLKRTSDLSQYYTEIDWDSNNADISKYVRSILAKYNITISDNIEDSISWKSEREYENIKNIILKNMENNTEDRDFIVAYLDNIRYNNWINFQKELKEQITDTNLNLWIIEKYLWDLSPEQLYALWTHSWDILKHKKIDFASNPFWAISRELSNWWTEMWLIFWIIWALFLKWNRFMWFLAWFLGWVWINALWMEWFKSLIDWDKSSNNTGNDSDTNNISNVDIPITQEDKILKSIIENRWSLDEEKLVNIYESLMKNRDFLVSDASNLFIFENDFEEQQSYFKSIWIELITENIEYYKHIFKHILNQRIKDWVWEPIEWELMNTYLQRTSNIETTSQINPDENTETETTNEVEIERFQTVWYVEDWKYYIIWENGEPTLVDFSRISLEFKEQIDEIKWLWKIIQNYQIFLQAYINSWTDKEKEIKTARMNDLQKRLNELNILDLESVSEFKKWIENIQDEIYKTYNIDLTNDFEVLSHIRKIDHNFARNELVNILFENTNISEEQLESFLLNPTTWNHNEIKEILWEKEFKKLRENVINKKADAEKYFLEYREDFIKQVEEQWVSREEAEKIVDEKYRDMIIDSFVYSYAKNIILKSFIKNHKDTWSWLWYRWDNELKDLYSDIVWIWIFNISDKTYDSLKFWTKEWFFILWTQVIAIWAWAVTMWAWYVAVNAAVWWTRSVRYANLYKVWQAANNWNKFAKAWRFWAMSVIEWASFHLGYELASSHFEWRDFDYFENLWHSIAFAWAFRALSSIKWLRFDPNKPLSQQKLKITSSLALDTVALWALWASFDGILFEPWEWTAEHLMQALVMAIAFRGSIWAWDKITLKFRKNWNQISAQSTTQTSWATNSINKFWYSVNIPQNTSWTPWAWSWATNSINKFWYSVNIPQNTSWIPWAKPWAINTWININIPPWLKDKITDVLNGIKGLTSSHKETIKKLLGISFLTTAGQGWIKYLYWEYDEANMLQIALDLWKIFVIHSALLAWWAWTIMLWKKWLGYLSIWSWKITSHIPKMSKKEILWWVSVWWVWYTLYKVVDY